MIVVYDTVTKEFLGNRIFDQNYIARISGVLPIARLRSMALLKGWKMMTADVFLETKPKSDLSVCISERITPRTKWLIDNGVVPAVIICGESPNVDWWFYHDLSKYARIFKHALFFRGVSDHVKPPTQFHTFYWPSDRIHVSPSSKWINREFLVMVNSNKDRFWASRNWPFLRTRRLAKRFLWNYLRIVDPLFKFKDLYEERLEAICYFVDRPGFRLFGRDWDQSSGLSKRHFLAVQRAGAKPVDDKLKTMSGFKFALCFENCVFPGYITEKIFDCFFAGCVPIYYGAPDITDFIPAETFIDFRQFQDIADLDEYLRGLSEGDAGHYLEAARSFLAGHEFDKFYQDTFVEKLLDILEQEFKSAEH